MNTYTLQKNIIFYVFGFLFLFVILFFPKDTFAACTLTAAQFRNFDYPAPNFPANWFQNSFMQNNAQPYAYLDLKFSTDCVGVDTLQLELGEYDSLDPNDTILGPYTLPSFQSNTLEQTLVFKAGDTYCDGGDDPDCRYFISIESPDYQINQNIVMQINYNCQGECDDQNWQYVGTVHMGNNPAYSYGNFVSPNDPDVINSQTGSGSQGDDVQTGGQGDDVQTGSQGDSFEPLVITEQIENPLGDGSSLPAFVQSLLGIVVRAGIPLIVLAIVYTGFRFVEARGNPNKIADAKKLLLYTLIGSAVILGAWTIATILTNTITTIVY